MSYCQVDQTTKDLVEQIIKKEFRYLETASIEILFDSKKRKSGGQYVLASLKKPDELNRFFTSKIANNGQGYDYILFLDENVMDVTDYADQERLIRHALLHATIDYESDTPYKLRKPDIQIFAEELKINKDDPKWMLRLQVVAESVYNPEKREDIKPSFMV